LRTINEWTLQSNLAAKEIMQIDKQIAAAEIRIELAKQELSNHIKQIENARQFEDLMRSKYTNQELYSWMIGQVSAIYFQSYQLAYDVAEWIMVRWRGWIMYCLYMVVTVFHIRLASIL